MATTEPANLAPENPDSLVDLPSGEGFRIEESVEVTLKRPANVILFAGTAECGKTTLLASLYLLLQKGPFRGFAFAGSRTLVGFERRVHNTRITSKLKQPKTERTKSSELLHLRLRPVERTSPARDLLLCDLWGEDFREARDSIEGCKRLPIIKRADSIVLLIDGGRLCRFDSRQQAKSDPIALLRNILDCDMLPETMCVDVVHTKWDSVENSSNGSDAVIFANYIDDEIKRLFGSRVAGLRFHRVAAHDPDGTRPLGHGIDALFQHWVDTPPGAARRHVRLASLPAGAPEFDAYEARLTKGTR